MNSIVPIVRQLGKFVYQPNFGNVGDALIDVATRKFFLKYNLPFLSVCSVNSNILPYNFVYGGGGACIQDWGCIPYLVQLFSSLRMNRVIILPSSFYNCDSLLEIFDERFTVFCRDKTSFNYCFHMNKKAQFLLADDMALKLNAFTFLSEETWDESVLSTNMFSLMKEWTRKSMYELQDGRKVLLILRNDRESCLGNDHPVRRQYRIVDLSVMHCDDWCDARVSPAWSYLFLTCLNNADIILTDRLHVAIGGYLLDKEVYILDNTYRKLSSVYHYSLYGSSNVKMMSSLDEFPYWRCLI